MSGLTEATVSPDLIDEPALRREHCRRMVGESVRHFHFIPLGKEEQPRVCVCVWLDGWKEDPGLDWI